MHPFIFEWCMVGCKYRHGHQKNHMLKIKLPMFLKFINFSRHQSQHELGGGEPIWLFNYLKESSLEYPSL